MTVLKLRALLNELPDNAPVAVYLDRRLRASCVCGWPLTVFDEGYVKVETAEVQRVPEVCLVLMPGETL